MNGDVGKIYPLFQISLNIKILAFFFFSLESIDSGKITTVLSIIAPHFPNIKFGRITWRHGNDDTSKKSKDYCIFFPWKAREWVGIERTTTRI